MTPSGLLCALAVAVAGPPAGGPHCPETVGDEEAGDPGARDRFRRAARCGDLADGWQVLHLYPAADRTVGWYPPDWNAPNRLTLAPQKVAAAHRALLAGVRAGLAAEGRPYTEAVLTAFNAGFAEKFGTFLAAPADDCEQVGRRVRAWRAFLGRLDGRQAARWEAAVAARAATVRAGVRARLDPAARRPVAPRSAVG